MRIFNPDNRMNSQRHQRLYAAYEMATTSIEFSAGLMFLIGSVLFFYPAHETAAIWFFVIGSAFFMISPTLRLVRELHYLALGDFEDLAKRVEQ